MSTLTPRTDAAWAQTVEDEENYGNAATDMRAECATLERELATEREKSERYRLATLKLDAELTAERARLDWLEMAEKTDHAHCPENDGQRWRFPYLMDGAGGFGGGVGHKYFDTLRAAIDAAMKEGTK